MVPRFFIWIPEIFVSQGPTPAARLSEWTLYMIRRALFEPFHKTQPQIRDGFISGAKKPCSFATIGVPTH